MALKPIQRPGATELLTYTARDFIGVQPAGEANRGINRAAEWTRDHHAWALLEHDETGLHDTPKIPRGIYDVTYDPQAGVYLVSGWHMGKGSASTPGLLSAAWVSRGTVDVTFSIPLPSTNCAIINASHAFVRSGTVYAVVVHGEILSSTKVRLYRRETAGLSPALADWDFSFIIAGG